MKIFPNHVPSRAPNTRTLTFALAAILAGALSNHALAAEAAAATTFASAEEAGAALFAASESRDDRAIERVLGAGSKDILDSGDAQADRAALAAFVATYRQMHRWATLTDGSRVLYIGADNYPYPVPLQRDASSRWHFDALAAEDEVLARRIGSNELLAIDAVNAIANAEEVYMSEVIVDGAGNRYTTSIVSTPGKHDGLYWRAPEDAVASPLGRVAAFHPDVDAAPTGRPPVFDGYAYRILSIDAATRPGAMHEPAAKAGAGLVVVASPVRYGDSGIMSFMLGRDGVVWQKDLGETTMGVFTSMSEYTPGDGWTAAE